MRRSFLIIVCVAVLLASVTTLAQTSSYTLTWWTIDGGSGTSQGGGYTLSGTIGQPDAGVLEGGDDTLSGGFWAGVADQWRLQLPLIIR